MQDLGSYWTKEEMEKPIKRKIERKGQKEEGLGGHNFSCTGEIEEEGPGYKNRGKNKRD